MTTRQSKRQITPIAITLAIILALAGGGATWWKLSHSDGRPTYRPTATERTMFDNLRPATDDEAKHGRAAVAWELGLNPRKPDASLDVYVAKKDFRTVYTDHRMAILLRPGVKWLGGPLGQVKLLLQDYTPKGKKKGPAEYQRSMKNFVFAPVIYDPFCYAQELGYATKAACTSTDAQRKAVTAKQMHLRTMPEKEYVRYYDLSGGMPSGHNIKHNWTTPAQSTTALSWTQTGGSGDNYVIPVTALKRGDKLTGGEFGHRYVVLETTRRVFYNESDSDMVHIVLQDPIGKACQDRRMGIYLSNDMVKRYQCT